MDWKKYYNERQINMAEAAEKVKSGDRLVAAHACGSPEPLLEAVVARADELEDVEIVHMVSMGKSEYCLPGYESSFRHNSIFAGSNSRQAIAEGRADFTTCYFSEIPLLFRNGHLPVDVAMITVSEPDKMGNVSLGISVDYTMEAVKRAKTVIAEVSPHMPRTMGNSFLHVGEIDFFVPGNRKMIELPPPAIGEVEKGIGYHVAKLIKDGDCLQLGIGAIPDAVLTFLGDKKNLGIHSEMISDGVMNLVEKGVITGKKKNFHPSKIVITFAMGSEKFYEWLDNNSMVEFYPVDYVNDPYIIAKNENMISINSAISVDLLGQVAADSMGAFQFSGVGGQVDFVRGAKYSPGGRSIIAIPATAAKGTKSRIVSALAQGQPVTTSRNDVDYVVTEYGVAHLTGKTVNQRAEALMEIAAPEFREALWKEFHEIYRK